MELSVILCTHNPRQDYLDRTLAALQAQDLPREQWEFLIIDNRSAEPLAGRLDLSWHAGGRIVREDKLGLTPARLRGIAEARGALLVFVDDDNVLDGDYLTRVLAIAHANPHLGSWSGQCIGEFDEPPPEWTRRYWGNLAIRQFDQDVWSNLPRLPETMPCGAGLCVRAAVAQEYLRLNTSGERSFQFDRTGDSLISGGDNDLAACACRVGLGVGLFAGLKLRHLMAPGRFTLDYMARLAEGIAFSSVLLDRQWGAPPRPRSRAGKLADIVRLAMAKEPHRTVLKAARRGEEKARRLLASSQ